MVKVAALQFASGVDVAENLATCIRMIDLAAKDKPALMVLPEFCNHISWYDDDDHAWEVALDLDGHFLQAIAAKARQHCCHLVINVSLRRGAGAITVSSLLYSPSGQLLEAADKQTLMGHENDFFKRAEVESQVVDTEIGRLGLFPCRDGVTFETPRGLALKGAQIFCDSLNSFALDEASLHVPARAPENKAFLVAANKIGPLIPVGQLEMVSAAAYIPVEFLYGAGESQIVAPNGEVLAKGPLAEEAVVIADIDPREADDKRRPDGSDSFANRRPELYRELVLPPFGAYTSAAAEQLQVACVTVDSGSRESIGKENGDDKSAEVLIAEALDQMQTLDASVDLVVLPELFCFHDSSVEDTKESSEEAVAVSQRALEALEDFARARALTICTSLVLLHEGKAALTSVILNEQGIVGKQPMLHACERHSWSHLADQLEVFDMPWGRCAILAGDDAVYPELVKVAALRGVHVLLLPIDIQEAWEPTLGLLSRAAENRINVVACSRRRRGGASLIAGLHREFTIMTPWESRKFDGNINMPIVTVSKGDRIISAEISPNAAANKLMSANTELLQDRPWQLSGRLVEPC